MRLVHWSEGPISAVESRKQSHESHLFSKPKGLWVSDEGAETSWSSWCEDNDFGGTTGRPYVYEVTLRPKAKVLFIETESDLVRFDGEYHFEPEHAYSRGQIDWPAVAEEYQGVIVSPYRWGQRLGNIEWYYGWDCASGCIWDRDAVQKLTALAPTLEEV